MNMNDSGIVYIFSSLIFFEFW